MSNPRQYELVYIIAPTATDADVEGVHAQVAATAARLGGTLDRTEPWGRRKLAYEIGRHREGIYVLVVFTGSAELVKELDRRLRVAELVIRHLIVRVDEVLQVAERSRAKRKAETARRRTARGLPPEPEPGEAQRREGGDELGDADHVEA